MTVKIHNVQPKPTPVVQVDLAVDTATGTHRLVAGYDGRIGMGPIPGPPRLASGARFAGSRDESLGDGYQMYVDRNELLQWCRAVIGMLEDPRHRE